MRAVLTLAIVLLLAPSVWAQAPLGVPLQGYWLTENGKAIIHFTSCGDKTCGRMVWTDNPRDETGALKLDVQNADAAKRDRPVCGLALMGALVPEGPDAWKDGWIYNPRDGSTYSVEVETVSATELKVRGFLGLSIFGSSQVWTRVDGDRGGC